MWFALYRRKEELEFDWEWMKGRTGSSSYKSQTQLRRSNKHDKKDDHWLGLASTRSKVMTIISRQPGSLLTGMLYGSSEKTQTKPLFACHDIPAPPFLLEAAASSLVPTRTGLWYLLVVFVSAFLWGGWDWAPATLVSFLLWWWSRRDQDEFLLSWHVAILVCTSSLWCHASSASRKHGQSFLVACSELGCQPASRKLIHHASWWWLRWNIHHEINEASTSFLPSLLEGMLETLEDPGC